MLQKHGRVKLENPLGLCLSLSFPPTSLPRILLNDVVPCFFVPMIRFNMFLDQKKHWIFQFSKVESKKVIRFTKIL